MILRCFYAHPYRWTEEQRASGCAAAREALLRVLFPGGAPLSINGRTFTGLELIQGGDDFTIRAPLEGGWRGWSYSVGSGTLMDGTPRFHVIALPERRMGRATAEIVAMAGKGGRLVLLVDGDAVLLVRGVIEHDAGDRAAGWEVVV